MSGCRLADTPIDPNQKLEDDKEGNPVWIQHSIKS
jgi:hypothetical protein